MMCQKTMGCRFEVIILSCIILQNLVSSTTVKIDVCSKNNGKITGPGENSLMENWLLTAENCTSSNNKIVLIVKNMNLTYLNSERCEANLLVFGPSRIKKDICLYQPAQCLLFEPPGSAGSPTKDPECEKEISVELDNVFPFKVKYQQERRYAGWQPSFELKYYFLPSARETTTAIQESTTTATTTTISTTTSTHHTRTDSTKMQRRVAETSNSKTNANLSPSAIFISTTTTVQRSFQANTEYHPEYSLLPNDKTTAKQSETTLTDGQTADQQPVSSTGLILAIVFGSLFAINLIILVSVLIRNKSRNSKAKARSKNHDTVGDEAMYAMIDDVRRKGSHDREVIVNQLYEM